MSDGRYSEGLFDDGAVILDDGVPVPIEDIVRGLNELTALKHDLTAAYMAGYEEGKGKMVDEAAELAELKERLKGLSAKWRSEWASQSGAWKARHWIQAWAGSSELALIEKTIDILADDLDAVIGND